MKIYLLRHGQTDWNLDMRMQGRTDIPLNEKGRSQAAVAAEKLKDIPFDRVYSSPLIRAFDTAKVIAKPHDLPVVTMEELIEMSFGSHEGYSAEDNPDPEGLECLFNSPKDYVPSAEGESYEDLDGRCQVILEKLKKLEGEFENILLVSHGALCKGLIRAMINADVSDFWNMPLLENCQPLEIEYADGKFLLPEEYDKFYGEMN